MAAKAQIETPWCPAAACATFSGSPGGLPGRPRSRAGDNWAGGPAGHSRAVACLRRSEKREADRRQRKARREKRKEQKRKKREADRKL
jgi:hypothetical protein